MTIIKLDGKPTTNAADALAPWGQALYATPGRRIVGIVELAHVERTEPAPDEDKEKSVKLRISSLEIANDQVEPAIRDAMRSMYMHRTSIGTLTEDGEVELSKETVNRLGHDVNAIESARRGAAVDYWTRYAYRVLHTPDITTTELLHELKTIADGLNAIMHRPAEPVVSDALPF